jgi:hypothetical protein
MNQPGRNGSSIGQGLLLPGSKIEKLERIKIKYGIIDTQ